MFKDLLKEERQKLWITSGFSATETQPYEQALASRAKSYAEDFGHEGITSDVGERRSWSGSHDVLAIARTASGL